MYIPSGKIYAIRNDINDRVYVGQTKKSLKQRWANHLRSLNDGAPIHRAIQIYGAEHFEIELLEECPIERLDEAERAWIIMLRAYEKGYNGSLGGLGHQKFLPGIIWDLLQQGKQVREICTLVGCGKDTVYKIANAHNWTVSSRSTKRIRKKTRGTDNSGRQWVFESPKDAAQWCIDTKKTTVTDATIASSLIRRCCNKRRLSAYGLRWKYV